MKSKEDLIIYIVAGDEMKSIMESKYPNRTIIPFRENLSIGQNNRYIIDNIFIEERSKALNVSKEEYSKKIKPMIDIDTNREYVLVFGLDDCCKANLDFVVKYLRNKGYEKKIKVNIVDEYNLDIIREYQL